MHLKTVNLMGMNFINTDMEQLVDHLDGRLAQSENIFLVTANTEIVMHARKNRDYYSIVDTADLVTPDGVGVVIGSKIIGNPIQQRLTGFDLMMQLLSLCCEKQYTVYFLGASPEVIERAVERVKREQPDLEIAGYHHGYFNGEEEAIAFEIRKCEPDIVFVGLGVPKQEQWIAKYRKLFKKGLFIGVGGSFDVLAGEVRRAPVAWQKLNIEWLYRLIQRPSRWKRMTVLPIFLLKTVKARVLRKNL
ncbi:MAG TPA: WecB/TagA/CpsF family glycosyltransferase [Bacillales bacterium]|nr:WecB/TagA/CpsF family glycosyltransferase [Bacillales bacterium]